MDGIKLFAKNEIELEILTLTVRIYNQDMGMEFGTKLCHANNEKRKTTYEGRNGTTKSRKNQNARRIGNLQILGNIGSGHNQRSGNKPNNIAGASSKR